MNLEYHPSPDSIEAYLNTMSVRQNAGAMDKPFAGTMEDHLLVCGICQQVAERELVIASLIRRCLVANEATLCRRRKQFSQ